MPTPNFNIMTTGAYVSEWDEIAMMRAVRVVWLLKYVSADQVCMRS